MYVLAIALSVLIGIALGLLGGGGSMLTTPILLYAMHLPAKEAIATSLIVVGTTSATAAIQHARSGNVSWQAGFIFGVAGMTGAYVGGRGAAYVPDRLLLGLFAAMMLGTAAAMFRGRKDDGVEAGDDAPPFLKTALIGLVVGVVPGLVGAGGGFLIVPALTLAAGLPMRKAVGTSLLVIALNSVAGYAGHAGHVSVDYGLAASVTSAAVAGSFVGSALNKRIPAAALRKGFAVFVLVLGLFVMSQQL
jgi:uncharacterized membrane protein YfcA